jgi:hypothetical protein
MSKADRQERREERERETGAEPKYGGMFDIIPESAKRASERADLLTAAAKAAIDAAAKAWLSVTGGQ